MCNAIWDTKIELHFGAGHAACCTFTAGRNESKIFQLPDPRSPDPETSWVECPQYDNNMETSSLVPVLAHTNLNATSARTHDLCPVLAQPTQAAVPIKLPAPTPTLRQLQLHSNWQFQRLQIADRKSLSISLHFSAVSQRGQRQKPTLSPPAVSWAKLAHIIAYEIRQFSVSISIFSTRTKTLRIRHVCLGGGDGGGGRSPDYAIITFYGLLQRQRRQFVVFSP